MFDNFEDWWHETGSGILPDDQADMESHAKKLALAAWIEMKERAVNIALIEADRDVAQSKEET